MASRTLQNLLSRWIAYPILHRRTRTNRAIIERFRQLERIQFDGRERLKERQLESLRRLLRHAAKNVPYYRALFREAGFDPEKVRDVAQLRSLPRLTKQIIRDRFDDLISEATPRSEMTLNFTGGSTGAALSFYQDESYDIERTATNWYSDYLAGWSPGASRARLWGAPRDLAEYTGWRARVRCFLYNYHQFNAFTLSDSNLATYHASLSSIRPAVLVCYASAAALLAGYCTRKGITPNYPTRGVITSAELLQPDMRAAIEKVFPARVFDRYGCREVGALASECDAHDGMHIHMLSNLVEIEADAPDNTGDVLVTNLSNYAMPLIRYEIGDRARSRDTLCTCGRGAEMLDSISGRVTDFFVGRDGNLIAGPSLTLLFYGVDSIGRYQFVQEDYDKYELKVVPSPKWDPAEVERLLKRIRLYLGEECEIQVTRVDEIPPTETGKHRFIVSKLKLPRDASQDEAPAASCSAGGVS